MAEVDTDCHNAEVLDVRQRPSTSASPAPPQEKKKSQVKQEVCWFHQKWGKEAKGMPKALLLLGKRVLGRHQGLGASPPQQETPGLQLLQSSYGPCSGAPDSTRSFSDSVPRQEPAPSYRSGSSTPTVTQ